MTSAGVAPTVVAVSPPAVSLTVHVWVPTNPMPVTC